jgi:hypothetical protein
MAQNSVIKKGISMSLNNNSEIIVTGIGATTGAGIGTGILGGTTVLTKTVVTSSLNPPSNSAASWL